MDYKKLSLFLNKTSIELDEILPTIEGIYSKLKKYRENIKNIQSELKFIEETIGDSPEILKAFSKMIPILAERDQKKKENNIDLKIDDISDKFTLRVYNALRARDIHTVRGLIEMGPRELMQTRNFGEVSLLEVKEVLENLGLSFEE